MIKVVNGTVGVFTNGLMAPKTSKDAPFELNEKREAELVAAGIAEYADTAKEDPEDDTSPEGSEQADGGENPNPVNLEAMNLAQLKDLAGQYGIDASEMRKKADVIAAIEAVGAEAEDEENADDGEDAPDLSVEEPV